MKAATYEDCIKTLAHQYPNPDEMGVQEAHEFEAVVDFVSALWGCQSGAFLADWRDECASR